MKRNAMSWDAWIRRQSVFLPYYAQTYWRPVLLLAVAGALAGLGLTHASTKGWGRVVSPSGWVVAGQCSALAVVAAWAVLSVLLTRRYLVFVPIQRALKGTVPGWLLFCAACLAAGVTAQMQQDVLLSSVWLVGGGLALAAQQRLTVRRLRLSKSDLLERQAKAERDALYSITGPLPADGAVRRRVEVCGGSPLAKFAVGPDWRHAVNLRESREGHVRLVPPLRQGDLAYALGWAGLSDEAGQVRLYVDNDGDGERRPVLNKSLRHLLAGWNEYQWEMPSGGTDGINLYWTYDGSVDLYLAVEPGPAPVEPAVPKRNVIVIVLDGAIPELIGLYRGEPEADHTSRFFKKGLCFTRAYAQGEWTLPNMASLATSLYPSRHGVHDPDQFTRAISREVPTLAECFQQNSFRTFGVVGAHRASPGYGHDRGYDRYVYRPMWLVEPHTNLITTVEAIRFLQHGQHTDNFICLHYMDTHYPYYPSAANPSGEADAMHDASVVDMLKKASLSKGDFACRQDLYRQKYREVDENLGLLFDYITTYEDSCTTVLLTADHGTTLYHPENTRLPQRDVAKDRYLCEANLHVPFLLRKAGAVDADVRSDAWVEANLAVMPTVLEAVGLDPPAGLDGVSVYGGGKGWALSESIYKDRYELALRTAEQEFFYAASRNRATGAVHAETGRSEVRKVPDEKEIHDPALAALTQEKALGIVRQLDLPGVEIPGSMQSETVTL